MFTLTWSRRNAASKRCLNPWGSNTPIVKRHACWLSGETRVGAITDECLESNGSIIEKIPPKGVRFSDFIAIFAVSYKGFLDRPWFADVARHLLMGGRQGMGSTNHQAQWQILLVYLCPFKTVGRYGNRCGSGRLSNGSI